MINEKGLKTYSKKERNMYFIGMAGQNCIYSTISCILAYYFQFTLLIPAATVSIAMTIARVWDAFNDPMMGTIVDRTRTKWGKCRPYLLFVPIPVSILTTLCFTNFGFYNTDASLYTGKNLLVVLWSSLIYILWGMTYTAGDIPLWGITALMTEDHEDRDKLLSFARIAGGVGAALPYVGAQSIALGLGKFFAGKVGDPAQGEKIGFFVSALMLSIVGGALFQLAGLFSEEKIAPSEEKHTLKENFALMWKNKPFRQILLSGVLSSPASLVMIAATPLITYYYSNKDSKLYLVYIIVLGGAIFLGQFGAMALVPKILKHTTKKKAYNYSRLLSVIPYSVIFVLYLLSPQGMTKPLFVVLAFLIFVVAGASLGITNVLQSIMIADAVDYEEYHNGIRPDGVFFSGQTFIAKLTAGIATILSGIAYSVVGFSDANVAKVNEYIANGGIARENPEFTKYMALLFFLVSIPPAIGNLLAAIPTWHYCLDDDEHLRILAELNERRRAAEGEERVETAETV